MGGGGWGRGTDILISERNIVGRPMAGAAIRESAVHMPTGEDAGLSQCCAAFTNGMPTSQDMLRNDGRRSNIAKAVSQSPQVCNGRVVCTACAMTPRTYRSGLLHMSGAYPMPEIDTMTPLAHFGCVHVLQQSWYQSAELVSAIAHPKDWIQPLSAFDAPALPGSGHFVVQPHCDPQVGVGADMVDKPKRVYHPSA